MQWCIVGMENSANTEVIAMTARNVPVPSRWRQQRVGSGPFLLVKSMFADTSILLVAGLALPLLTRVDGIRRILKDVISLMTQSTLLCIMYLHYCI